MHSFYRKALYPGITIAMLLPAALHAQQPVPGFDTASLDRTQAPCSDFDEFVNGNWKKLNPIPNTESRWGSFSILDKENKEVRLRKIIIDLSAQKKFPKGTEAQQIADYYKSYTNIAAIDRMGITPIKKYLDAAAKIKSVEDYARFSGMVDPIGISSVVGFGVYGDRKNSKMNAVYLGQSGLSLREKSYYSRTDSASVALRNEFVKHLDKMFALARIEGFTGQEILEFETQLADIQLSNVERRDPIKTYNKMSFAELEKLSPVFSLGLMAKGIGIVTDSIIVQNPNYVVNVNELLARVPVQTLRAYATWKVLSNFANYLPEPFQEESFHFYGTVMNGIKERKPLEERAIRSTDGILGMPLGKIFAQQYFPESSKKKVAEMVENVRAAFSDRINQLTWMTPETKANAQKKLAKFTYKIGYPDKWKDYSTIHIDSLHLIDNIISASLYDNHEAIMKIGKPVDRSEWGMTPQTVNAYYNAQNNEVVFPAGILQPPFFNPNADDAVNYGGIIAVIGHEFTHGFDDKGSQFDGDGNMNNWWTAQDRKNFDSLSQRYIDYFNKLEPLPGYKVNGALTIGENIADLGGITLAYNALKKSLTGKPEPAPIDGFTWQQRFFLGWAQVWHTNIMDAALRTQVQTDTHSPAHYRINVPLTHFRPFQEAFHCPDGSPMTLPDNERVVIW